MPGKAYSMREMRQIVDYLVDQRAYEEIRGRKMWMDFANSKRVDRTWQSLKETFLKRILPDIQNPYYKLTPEQMASFRQGYDVAKRNKNKLELRSMSEESSNSTTENHRKNNDGAGTSKNEQNPPGENIQCSKLQPSNRSSTETLVLENCYENAEEIQRELESPKNDDVRSMKSLKDLITYSEPLTPMLQEVIDDFATDDEEPQLQIVEEVVDDPNIDADRLLIRESASLKKTEEVNGNESKKLTEDTNISKKAQETVEISETVTNGDNKQKDIVEKNNNAEKNNNDTDVIVIEDSENKTKDHENSQQKTDSNIMEFSCNDTPDSVLPNNQEGFKNNSNSDKRTSNEMSTTEIPDSNDVGNKKAAGKDLQLKTTEKRVLRSNKQLTETNSVIEITENPEEPIVIDSHSTIEPEQDSAKNVEDFQQPDIPESINTTNNQKEKSVDEIIATENNSEPKDVSKENNSQEAVPSTLNNELNEPSEINPCLKSVSLYAEQFSQSKYSDSESSDREQETKQNKTEDRAVESKKEKNILSIEKTVANEIKSPTKTVKKVVNGIDDVVLLKSHSESDSEHFEGPKPQPKKKVPLTAKTDRDIVLANVFGFSTGAVSRKRSVSYRGNSNRYTKRCRTTSRSHYNNNASASSSSVSSDSTPPCCRKERNNGNYLKPKSYDILTEAGGGGLFVIGDDKKLHEVVMSGKNSMNHLHFDDNGDEATDGFWRKKFFEEKLRADELSRLLKNAQETRVPAKDRGSPILRANPSTSSVKDCSVQKQLKENCDKTESKTQIAEDVKDNKNHVKIKFTKDNEIELECQWPHVHPVLEQMAQMFHKNTDRVEAKGSTTEAKVETTTAQVFPDPVPVSSGMSTPVLIPTNPAAQERINKIESEIFKEIEERDKTEATGTSSVDRNVTKRTRGRPRKDLSLSTSRSSSVTAKKAKSSSEGDVSNVRETVDKPPVQEAEPPSDAASTSSKRPTRTPKRFTSEPENNVEIKTKVTRASTSKHATSVEVEIPDDSQVRYMFPKSPTIPTRSNSKLIASKKNDTKHSRSYPSKTPRIFSSPDISTTNSIESTQGYQDSDNSPTKLPLRRKRKLSGSSHSQKGKEQSRRKIRRKSYPYLADDDTIEDVASNKQSSKAATQNSSLDTEVYRSESYQLLLPKARPSSKLNKIDELGPLNEVDDHFRSLSPLTIDLNEFLNPLIKSSDSTNSGQRVENSSNVSLPLSPELSVVENISISKDMISSEDQPTINETQANDSSSQDAINKYMISDVDVSVPLMGQDLELRKTRKNVTSDVRMTKTTVSESLLSKICTVNIEEPSSSDSLDQKLRDMLLESARKMSIQIQDDLSAKENMEIDATASEQKKRAKKRCSTPRKKKDTFKSKVPTIVSVEEERIEFCSRGGRSSCPPSLNVAALIDDNIDINTETNNNKGKQKKDIIKVKILRPKDNKKRTKEKKKSLRDSCMSVCTDSGINDTESGVFLGINDSVDLIHNHSETCILANECIGDSIEFLDNTAKSVLTVSSNTSDSREGMTPDLFCNDAREATSLSAVTASQGDDNPSAGAVPARFSPASFNSLITEDLSDEIPIQSQPRPSKWYLLSEEETTNTNFVEAPSPDHNAGCFNANLKHIFPITCAVPDLSTITEMSRENDSRKPIADVGACNDLKHSFQSIFD